MARTRIPKKFKKKQGGSQIDYPIEKTTLKIPALLGLIVCDRRPRLENTEERDSNV